MSTIPPRAVHGGTEPVYSRDFIEHLRELSRGVQPLPIELEHNGLGATAKVCGDVSAHSDTIIGARDRTLARLATTMLDVMAWSPETAGRCRICNETREREATQDVVTS